MVVFDDLAGKEENLFAYVLADSRGDLEVELFLLKIDRRHRQVVVTCVAARSALSPQLLVIISLTDAK